MKDSLAAPTLPTKNRPTVTPSSLPRGRLLSAKPLAAVALPAKSEPIEEEPSLVNVRNMALGGAVSSVLHAVFLIVLGLISVQRPQAGNQQATLLAAQAEIPAASFDALETTPITLEVARTVAEVAPLQPFVAPINDPTPVTPGADAHDSLEAISSSSKVASLAKAAFGIDSTSFFGVPAQGKRFVFVVDNSNSMNGKTKGGMRKFDRAVDELLATIDELASDKSYYVVFFNAEPTRMFDPQPAPDLVRSTTDNYFKLVQWLKTVELAKKTKAKGALQVALDLKPDAIFLLGDGAFTDDTASALVGMNRTHTPIHTLFIGRPGKDTGGLETMQRIAAEHRGTFTLVD